MARLSVTERALTFFGLGIARLVYRVTTIGRQHLPEGGALLLPNHITWVDAIVLLLASRRPIRFIIDDEFYRNPILRPVLRTAGCIPITTRRVRHAMREAIEKIQQGEIVCLFPEGQLSRTGTLLRLRRGYELIAREAGVPVIPVWLDRLWGSIFSFQGGRFFRKWPKAFPYNVTVAFGAPIPAAAADLATVRETLLKLGEACYGERPILREHLAAAAVRGLKRNPFRNAIIDGLDNTSLSRGKLLGIACALASFLKKNSKARRIGIVLPPGRGGVVANLAIVLAGKIPVNLNFTSARDSSESSIKQAELDTIITAQLLVKRLEDFPWTDRVIHLDELLPGMKSTIFAWWIFAIAAPSRVLLSVLDVPVAPKSAEALLLFTSGSSGRPKGVALTHRNILANVSQFGALLDASDDDVVLASLPFFHSFGCTVTLWYPLIEGVRVVSYPNPLEAAKIAALVERHAVTIMLATPTFLRAYLRKAEPSQLRSLRLLITGAEKLPDELAKAFISRFGKEVLQGYGLTETAPVVSVNLPQLKARNPREIVQPTNRLGSTGKLLPGIAAEIRDAETGRKKTLHDAGMLWLRGANVFEGYLGNPEETAEVLKDGWFKTGDIARFDEDGFLYIEGRLSRFSKIGGEMVPHETIEQKIVSALKLDEHAERVIAVVGVTDAAKGEALVILSSVDLDLSPLRASLSEAGMPNLWIPKTVRRIEAIPVLASGKLDLAKCKELVTEP